MLFRKKQDVSEPEMNESEKKFADALSALPAEELGEEPQQDRKFNVSKLLYAIVLFVVFGALFASIWNFGVRLLKYGESEDLYADVGTEDDMPSLLEAGQKNLKTPALTTLGTKRGDVSIPIRDKETEQDPYLTDRMRLEKWKNKNSEVYGWIEVPGETMINYPLVYSGIEDKYLTYAADGSFNPAGAIFIDPGCQLPHTKNFNTVIWGHHMEFGAPMFANLLKYSDEEKGEEYYRDNRYIKIFTEEDGMTVYEIFAAYKMDPYFEENSCYDPEIWQVEDREDFLAKIEERNLLQTDIVVGVYDEVVSLCTCADNGSMRFTVQARRIEPDQNGNYPV